MVIFYPGIGFKHIAQSQAVEFVLKGYLYWKEIISTKTHSLVNLSEICTRQGLELSEEIIGYLNILTDYYFESRYPDMLDINLLY